MHGTKQEWLCGLRYLLKLAAGWAVGMALAVTVLAGAFTDGNYQLSALFLGFVLVSIPLVMREQRAVLGAFRENWLPFLAGIVLVVCLSALRLSALVNDLGFSAGTALYAFAAGALAISAMVLPGMMLGSLYAIVVGPTTLKVPQYAMTISDFRLLWFALGIAVMLGLEALKRREQKAAAH